MQICVKVNGKPNIFEVVNKRNGGFYEIHVLDEELKFFKSKLGKTVKTFCPMDKDVKIVMSEYTGNVEHDNEKIKCIQEKDIDDNLAVLRADTVTILTKKGLKTTNVVVLFEEDRPYFYEQYLKKGYSNWDLHDMDGYLSQLIGAMTKDFGKINVGIWSFKDKDGVYRSNKNKTYKTINDISDAFSSYHEWRDDIGEKRDKKAREFRKQFKSFMKNFGSFWI